MATIKKRTTKDGSARWDAQVYVGRHPATGKPQFLAKTFQRESEAKAWARKQETLKDNGDRPSTTRQTFAEYLRDWLEVHAGQVRSVTIYNYGRTVHRWVLEPKKGAPLIGGVRLSQLTVHDFERLYLHLSQSGMQPRGVRYLHTILKRALRDAVKKGLLPKNPADFASVPKKLEDVGEDEGLEAMTREQAERFLNAAKADRLAALWYVLLLGMVRPCEAFGLKWPDVDFDSGSIRVRASLTRLGLKQAGHPIGWKLTPPKTKTSRRTVPLPPMAMAELKLWRTQQKKERLQAGADWQEHGFVFTTEVGTPLDLSNVCRRPFRGVMEAAGLGAHGPVPAKPRSGPTARRKFNPAFRIYALRHTGATLLLMAGESLKVVSERLGHASIVLTADTYSHVLPTMQQAAAEKLQVMFG